MCIRDSQQQGRLKLQKEKRREMKGLKLVKEHRSSSNASRNKKQLHAVIPETKVESLLPPTVLLGHTPPILGGKGITLKRPATAKCTPQILVSPLTRQKTAMQDLDAEVKRLEHMDLEVARAKYDLLLDVHKKRATQEKKILEENYDESAKLIQKVTNERLELVKKEHEENIRVMRSKFETERELLQMDCEMRIRNAENRAKMKEDELQSRLVSLEREYESKTQEAEKKLKEKYERGLSEMRSNLELKHENEIMLEKRRYEDQLREMRAKFDAQFESKLKFVLENMEKEYFEERSALEAKIQTLTRQNATLHRELELSNEEIAILRNSCARLREQNSAALEAKSISKKTEEASLKFEPCVITEDFDDDDHVEEETEARSNKYVQREDACEEMGTFSLEKFGNVLKSPNTNSERAVGTDDDFPFDEVWIERSALTAALTSVMEYYEMNTETIGQLTRYWIDKKDNDIRSLRASNDMLQIKLEEIYQLIAQMFKVSIGPSQPLTHCSSTSQFIAYAVIKPTFLFLNGLFCC
eukprot:TRINITY_DN8193_c0_g1_i4.p1 TRINITY_DN8193_c0_g1~~TRINITY_DN8193_c0_g1_i4.p1  ORF type:complete len:549 (+),score=134.53 TRINITY_DN8193_c0_g1_i4:61-1647(+)